MEDVELGSRARSQPAPPRTVWESLVHPDRSGVRAWLELLDDEVQPRVLERIRPCLVVWSSLWPARPHDRIRFDLRADGDGSMLRWTLTTPEEPPDSSKLGHVRRRLNVLINERLRLSYGQ